MMFPLSKYHSYGNDFLIALSARLKGEEMGVFARAACEPHFGLGADGCLFLEITQSQPSLRIFNRDGSEAGMSGNGARCAAAFLHHKGLIGEPSLALATPSGTKHYQLVSHHSGRWTYQSEMGQPAFEAAQIPFRSQRRLEAVQDFPLKVQGRTVRVHALSVGNPQCAVLVEALPSDTEFELLGAALERHRRFPQGTNVSFVQRLTKTRLKIRIWERGVGPTHSSGTGSCGAAVAAIRHGLVESPVTVTTSTGEQLVRWTPGEMIHLTGAAEFIADIQFSWQKSASRR